MLLYDTRQTERINHEEREEHKGEAPYHRPALCHIAAISRFKGLRTHAEADSLGPIKPY